MAGGFLVASHTHTDTRALVLFWFIVNATIKQPSLPPGLRLGSKVLAEKEIYRD